MCKETYFRSGIEVITETGIKLGWVRESKLKPGGDSTSSLLLTSVQPSFLFGWIGSRYEISVKLVTHSSESRVLVREGAEAQIFCLQTGLLEKFGFRDLPWQKQNEGWYVRPIVSVSNGSDDEGHLNPVPKPTSPTSGGGDIALGSSKERGRLIP